MPRQVFITGASSDIGVATCRRYLKAGYRVLAHFHQTNRDFDALQRGADNGTLLARQADFTNPNAAENLIRQEPELFQNTDALVNMAALREAIKFKDVSPDDILRHMTANVIPALMFIRYLGPQMAKRKWGRIVNITSIGVKFGGGPTTFCYSLTKHTMEYMPAIVRKEWAARNVFVNAIRLGITDTKTFAVMDPKVRAERVSLIPAKRMAAPDEMAETIFFYGSERNSFTTGEVITIAGGE